MNIRSRKRSALTCIALGLTLSWTGSILLGADKEPGGEKETLMQRKLIHAKNILEGLTLEKFEKVQEEGRALKVLSTMDQWKKFSTPAYDQLSSEFRSAVDKMIDSAGNRNLAGATLGFNQMTTSCIECHQLIRDGGLVTGLK